MCVCACVCVRAIVCVLTCEDPTVDAHQRFEDFFALRGLALESSQCFSIGMFILTPTFKICKI